MSNILELINEQAKKLAEKKYKLFNERLSKLIREFDVEDVRKDGEPSSFSYMHYILVEKFSDMLIKRFAENEASKIIERLGELEAYFRREE